MEKYKISYACATNIGNVRRENQDNFYIDGKIISSENEAFSGVFENAQIIAAVCDGMGGEANGKDASLLAAKRVGEADADISRGKVTDTDKLILSYISLANEDVYEMSKRTGEIGGTTINVVYINGKTASSYNLGDSRTYLYRDGTLTQLSRDHTTVADMVRLGALSEEEALRHPRRNQLNQYVGMPTKQYKLDPHVLRDFELRDDDILLICSDGLTDMCGKPEIIAMLSAEKELKEIADDLMNSALEHGGKDNITVILLRLKE